MLKNRCKASFVFLAGILLIAAIAGVLSGAIAGDVVHQQSFHEKVYEPIPPEFIKITDRLSGWLNRTEVDADNLHSSTNPKVVAWLKAINGIHAKNDLDLIRQINVITNRAVTYVDDYVNYGKSDHWATPYQTLTRGGDCEDIALLKTIALRLKKWDVKDNTYLMIGMINLDGMVQPHAVLQVSLPGSRHYVMCSTTDNVPTFDQMNKIMKPIYMVDQRRIILFSPAANPGAIAPAAGRPGPRIPLSAWESLSDKQREAEKNVAIEDDGMIGQVFEQKSVSPPAPKNPRL